MFDEKYTDYKEGDGYGQSVGGYGGEDYSSTATPAKEPVKSTPEPTVEDTPLPKEEPMEVQEEVAEPLFTHEPEEKAEANEPEQNQAEEPKEEAEGFEKQQEQAEEDFSKEQSTYGAGFGQGQRQQRTYYSADGRPTGGSGESEQGSSYGFGGSQPPPYGHNLYGDLFRKQPTSNSLSTVALVCSLFSIILSCCGGIAAIVCGGFAILFAFMSKSRNFTKKMDTAAQAAFVLAIIGIVFGIFALSLRFFVTDEMLQSILEQVESTTTTTTSPVIGGEMNV